MKNWIKDNWYKLLVIVLLIMIYSRLGEISKNAFYIADIIDSRGTEIKNSMIDYLDEIKDNTQNTWQLLDN